MGLFYEKVVRPVLFKLDSEHAHEVGVKAMSCLGRFSLGCRLIEKHTSLAATARPVECFGLKFPNAIGLAAGFDKNAQGWTAAAALGFGHVEIGTVTRLSQPGNPRPRMFRYPGEQAVINRMGFNNQGAEAVAARLAGQPGPGNRRIPLGINIGKSKVAPLDQAIEDYLGCFSLLADYADYMVINVSSPNTPDLRKLQEEDRLRALLEVLVRANAARVEAGRPRRPLLLKIAPDLNYRQIDSVLGIILDQKFDGIIATNTTLARPGFFGSVNETGGLSGAPLRDHSTQIISYIAKATQGKLPIIGVGGITDGASAGEKLDAGASLVQVYTGMIYRGPFFARDLASDLSARQIAWR